MSFLNLKIDTSAGNPDTFSEQIGTAIERGRLTPELAAQVTSNERFATIFKESVQASFPSIGLRVEVDEPTYQLLNKLYTHARNARALKLTMMSKSNKDALSDLPRLEELASTITSLTNDLIKRFERAEIKSILNDRCTCIKSDVEAARDYANS